MKKYIEPILEIEQVEFDDVLFTSSPFAEVHDFGFEWGIDEEL